MNRTMIGLGVTLAGAALATAGIGAGHAAVHRHFDLIANAPTNSLLAHPCSTCIDISQPEGAHLGGTEYDSGTLSKHGLDVGHFALVSVGVTPFNGENQPGELQLTATLVLPGGQLVGQGIEEPPLERGVLAITGGTGRYANARGTVRYTDNPDGSTSLQVNLIS